MTATRPTPADDGEERERGGERGRGVERITNKKNPTTKEHVNRARETKRERDKESFDTIEHELPHQFIVHYRYIVKHVKHTTQLERIKESKEREGESYNRFLTRDASLPSNALSSFLWMGRPGEDMITSLVLPASDSSEQSPGSADPDT